MNDLIISDKKKTTTFKLIIPDNYDVAERLLLFMVAFFMTEL